LELTTSPNTIYRFHRSFHFSRLFSLLVGRHFLPSQYPFSKHFSDPVGRPPSLNLLAMGPWRPILFSSHGFDFRSRLRRPSRSSRPPTRSVRPGREKRESLCLSGLSRPPTSSLFSSTILILAKLIDPKLHVAPPPRYDA